MNINKNNKENGLEEEGIKGINGNGKNTIKSIPKKIKWIRIYQESV